MTKRKTRPDVGASERVETGIALQCCFPGFNFISTAPCGQWRISELLPHGQANAVPLRSLVSITGLDGRKIRLLIAQERREGVPIISDNSSGYFLAETQVEREAFCRSMRHRAKEIMRAADAVAEGGALWR